MIPGLATQITRTYRNNTSQLKVARFRHVLSAMFSILYIVVFRKDLFLTLTVTAMESKIIFFLILYAVSARL